MAYIGTQPLAGQYRKLDDISSGFNGATTSFTTSVGGTNVTAGSPQQLLVSLGGVIQQPTTDYTVNTSTIIFTTAPASELSFFAILMGDALNTSVPADGSITSAKLAGSLSVGLAAGSASTPSLFFTGDTNTGIYSPGADQVAISTNGTGRITIDGSGNVNIDSNTLYVDATNNRVGIGTTSPSQALHTVGNGLFTGTVDIGNETSGRKTLTLNSGDNGAAVLFRADAATRARIEVPDGETALAFGVETAATPTERMRIDSSGRLLVGTSSSSSSSRAVFQGNSGGSGGFAGLVKLSFDTTSPGSTADIGRIAFTDSGHGEAATISGRRDGGTWTSGSSQPTALVFSTTADGASSPTERMRISSNGDVLVAKTVINSTDVGCALQASGTVWATRSNDSLAVFNRKTTDGNLIEFQQDGTNEGSITVSGTTVSYNGAHLSRWSQIKGIDPHDKTDRPEILRGTVMSNLDEMCDWIDPESGDAQDNEQLNKTKVSDVEGDKNVAGIFQSWDDDDDTWVNDYYLAMTGDFVIRIAAGVTVERGDLLMSAGDGTAKPQDDDIIRSKTIAKVTSTTVSRTYDDGSYCVPCVLMAC